MYEKCSLEYNTLEPYIGDKTLDIHYNRHYMSYLTKLNKLLQKNNYNYRYSMPELVKNIDVISLTDRAEVLYNLGGVLNHCLYFYIMSQTGNHKPVGKINEKINETYGNYDNFRNEFIKNATKLAGSGYTFLVLDKNNKLKIINTSNQDTPYYYGFTPIIALDLWEHAYYLDYQNNRNLYINNFFKIIDFDKINKLYENIIKK